MKFAVIVFPGSNCDHDTYYAIRDDLGQEVEYVWHKDASLDGFDCVIVPGGFSYGDYLRAGAIARFSPIMAAVERFAARGGPVLGICNGFQILAEAGLLPGALRRNDSLQFRCQWVNLRVESLATPFTRHCSPGSIIRLPIAHGEGGYYADKRTLEEMSRRGQIILRYSDERGRAVPSANPNGSVDNIAGICNREGNVFGLMPHPERASNLRVGGTDGLHILRSVVSTMGFAVGGSAGKP